MEREWLQERLAQGTSIAAIAREAGKGTSTVAYWMNKHGLAAANARRHQARGALEEPVLRELVERGLSVRQIATQLARSPSVVRYWLRRFDLTTQPAGYQRSSTGPVAVMRECRTHGWTTFQPTGARRYYRCSVCNTERVLARRRWTKQLLVAENGGRCVLCGYERYPGALHFHHVDPATKRFEIGGRGLTRSLGHCGKRIVAASCSAATVTPKSKPE